eukprot:4622643-Pleurochrysis_carterae.AAC.1
MVAESVATKAKSSATGGVKGKGKGAEVQASKISKLTKKGGIKQNVADPGKQAQKEIGNSATDKSAKQPKAKQTGVETVSRKRTKAVDDVPTDQAKTAKPKKPKMPVAVAPVPAAAASAKTADAKVGKKAKAASSLQAAAPSTTEPVEQLVSKKMRKRKSPEAPSSAPGTKAAAPASTAKPATARKAAGASASPSGEPKAPANDSKKNKKSKKEAVPTAGAASTGASTSTSPSGASAHSTTSKDPLAANGVNNSKVSKPSGAQRGKCLMSKEQVERAVSALCTHLKKRASEKRDLFSEAEQLLIVVASKTVGAAPL